MSKRKLLTPFVTVDVALFTIEGDRLKVFLAKRAAAPFKGHWALPGGALKPEVDLDLSSTAHRVMGSKLGLVLPHMEEVCSISGADRDPRGWSISLLYLALLPVDQVHAVSGNKVDQVDWFDANDVGVDLAFDHSQLLMRAVMRLREKVASNALPLHMLPQKFTLTQLQRTAEIVIGRALEKSAFRRRLKDFHAEDLEEVAGEFERGVQRPAQLWRARPGFQFNGR